MLSSLLTLLKSLHRTLVEHFAPRQPSDAAPPCPADIRAGDEDCLRGVVEVSYCRGSREDSDTQSVWIRVDTQKLIQRLCEKPDIDLDALQAKAASEPPTSPTGREPPKPVAPCPEAPAAEIDPLADPWHRKVRRITQAPPSSSRGGRPRPPPSSHH